MDVYYMSDSIQYSSFRGPTYRDYEKFPYGTLENPLSSPVHKPQKTQRQNGSVQGKLLNYIGVTSKSKKDACPFCKEQKKRPLGAYMRKRGQRINSESISEDVEEGEEAEENEEPTESVNANQHVHHNGRNFNRQVSSECEGK